MNAIFLIFCTLALALTAIFSPQSTLSSMLDGVDKAIKLSAAMLGVYALWLGTFEIAERSGIIKKLAKVISPLAKFLFGTKNAKTQELISLNLSANLLGVSGLATPAGVAACEALERENNQSGAQTLLVVAATSVQLLPLSVLTLMASYGAKNAGEIILPAFLSGAISTVVGILLIKIFNCERENATKNLTKKTPIKEISAIKIRDF